MRRTSAILVFFLLLPLTGCLWRSHSVKRTAVPVANLREATRDQLVNSINSESAKIQTLNATVDIAASVGGEKKGKVTDYTDIKGYLLVREPNMLRMIGLFPVVRNKAFDMVSDGDRFKLSIPTKNKFVEGSNEVVRHSDNPLENLRPQVIFNALLLHPIDQHDDVAVLEVGMEEVASPKSKTPVHQPDYELIVSHKGEQGWYLARKIIFSRTDLLPHRQIIYDLLGNIATDALYDNFKDYSGTQFPSKIDISRPQEEYKIVLTIEDLKVNAPLKPEQFALAQPPGAQVVNLDMQSAAALRASDGNSSKPDNKQKPKSQMD